MPRGKTKQKKERMMATGVRFRYQCLTKQHPFPFLLCFQCILLNFVKVAKWLSGSESSFPQKKKCNYFKTSVTIPFYVLVISLGVPIWLRSSQEMWGGRLLAFVEFSVLVLLIKVRVWGGFSALNDPASCLEHACKRMWRLEL